MDLDGAVGRLDATADRREPTKKGYHTGLRAAGRESAAQQLCSIEKDVRRTYRVAPSVSRLDVQTVARSRRLGRRTGFEEAGAVIHQNRENDEHHK